VLSGNHEASAFAGTCLGAAYAGVPAPGALVLGLVGAWAGDWPDLDMPGATVTKSLRWIPYRRHYPRDPKTGDYKTRKDGSKKVEVRWFPSWPMHVALCRASAAIWDRWATELDRADKTKLFGPAFRVHRGFSHSFWLAGCTGLIWWALLSLVPWSAGSPERLTWIFGTVHPAGLIALAITGGMIFHILGDGCTDFGVAPFAPLIKVAGRRYWHAGLWEPIRFKVSHAVEKMVIAPLIGVAASWAVAGAFIGPDRVLQAIGDTGSALWSALA
jgi:hypothetical protein